MLKKLWIQGFRNLQETVIDFGDSKQVVIFGENNQGKTNFLEAVHVVINGHSPLDDKVEHWVAFGENQALLGIDFPAESGLARLYCKINNEGKKWGVLEGKPLKSYTTIKPLLRSEYLSSDVIRIFKDSPDHRRRDLDKFCSYYFPGYAVLLKKYERVIKQKNAILKLSPDPSEVRFWNLQILSLCSELLPIRLEALDRIQGELSGLVYSEAFPFRAETGKQVSLKYVYSWTKTPEKAIQDLEEKLELNLSKEIQVGHTLYGIHRDDFDIFIDDKKLFHFFSRGINRLMAVLLKLAQLQLIEKKDGVFPLLLLDDTFSEVDPKIKKIILMALVKQERSMMYTSVIEEDKFLFDKAKVGVMNKGGLSFV